MGKIEEYRSKWMNELDSAIEEYRRFPWAGTHSRIEAVFLEGIRRNVVARFPARMTDDDRVPDFELAMTVSRRTGDGYTVMLTKPDDRFDFTLNLSIRRVMESIFADDVVKGISINPLDGKDVIISRELLEAAADFPEEKFDRTDIGYVEEFRRNSSEVYRLDVPRPMRPTGYCFVYALFGELEPGAGDGIDIEFRNSVGGDAIRSVLIRREKEDSYRMELVFDMGDFEWDRPLVLTSDVDFETAAGIVKRLGVYGEESGSIEEIYNGFKSIS